MFRATPSIRGRGDRRIPGARRALSLQQRFEIGQQRYRQAHARYYGGLEGEEDGAGGLVENARGGNAQLNIFDADLDGNYAPVPRGRVDRRRSDENFLSAAWYLLRCQLKLLMLVCIIIYFSSLISVQAKTDGWVSTRRLGYRQIDTCTETGDHYGVLSIDMGKTTEVAPFVFKTDTKSSSGIRICAYEGGQAEFSAFLLDKHNSTSKTERLMLSFLDEEFLLSEVDNLGASHQYFPNTLAIMLFSQLSLLLTIALELYPHETQEEAFLNFKEKAVVRRVNLCSTWFLVILLLTSTASFRFLMDESCELSFGLPAKNKILTDQMDAARTFCTELGKRDLVISSIVNPSEPFVQDYAIISRVFCFLLAFGLFIKPNLNEERHHATGVVPLNSLMELVNEMNTRRGIHQIRGSGNAVGRNLIVSNDFMNRYSEIAQRSKLTRKWKLLNFQEDNASAEEINRQCSICLDYLFPRPCDQVNKGHIANTLEEGERKRGGDECRFTDEAGAQTEVMATPEKSVHKCAGAGSAPPPSNVDLEAGLGGSEKPVDPSFCMTTDAEKENHQLASPSAEVLCCFILPCGHKYHKPCILEWALKNSTCPECRANLDGSKPEPIASPASRQQENNSRRVLSPDGFVYSDEEGMDEATFRDDDASEYEESGLYDTEDDED